MLGILSFLFIYAISSPYAENVNSWEHKLFYAWDIQPGSYHEATFSSNLYTYDLRIELISEYQIDVYVFDDTEIVNWRSNGSGSGVHWSNVKNTNRTTTIPNNFNVYIVLYNSVGSSIQKTGTTNLYIRTIPPPGDKPNPTTTTTTTQPQTTQATGTQGFEILIVLSASATFFGIRKFHNK